jgi:hypothetical protein
VPALPAWLIEPLWLQFAALLPQRPVFDPAHPLGCHRRRIDDRIVSDKLVQVSRFGCSYQGIADSTCSATTIRDRRDEWIDLTLGPFAGDFIPRFRSRLLRRRPSPGRGPVEQILILGRLEVGRGHVKFGSQLLVDVGGPLPLAVQMASDLGEVAVASGARSFFGQSLGDPLPDRYGSLCRKPLKSGVRRRKDLSMGDANSPKTPVIAAPTGQQPKIVRLLMASAAGLAAGVPVYIGIARDHPSSGRMLIAAATGLASAATATTAAAATGFGTAKQHRARMIVGYVGPDRVWAEWVRGELTDLGYETELRPWPEAVARRRRKVVLVAAHAFAVTVENDDAQMRHLDRVAGKHLIVAGLDGCPAPDLPNGCDAPYLGRDDPARAREELRKALQRCGWHRGAFVPESADDALFPGIRALPDISKPRIKGFVGRSELFTDLFRTFVLADGTTQPRLCALYGEPGTGKSSFAREYAYRYRAYYQNVWWIDAEHKLVLTPRLREIANELNVAFDNPESDVKRLWRAIVGKGRGLIVFDNVEDVGDITPWLPTSSGAPDLLITTQTPDWPPEVQVVPLGPLSPDEAVGYLREQTAETNPEASHDHKGATRVAEALGYLPKSLEMAALCVSEDGLSWKGYLALMADVMGRRAS